MDTGVPAGALAEDNARVDWALSRVPMRIVIANMAPE
jgi:hypothetical protein